MLVRFPFSDLSHSKLRPAVALADAIAVDPMRRPFVCLGSGRG